VRRLSRFGPVIITGVVILGAVIAAVQGHVEPLAAYAAILGAVSLGLQLARAATEKPRLEFVVDVGKMERTTVLALRAHNAGQGVVTLHSLGLWHERDREAPRLPSYNWKAAAERGYLAQLTPGGPRFDAAIDLRLAAGEALIRGVPAQRFAWVEDGHSVRHWRPIPRELIAIIEQRMAEGAAAATAKAASARAAAEAKGEAASR
jgi:hypothetical protein